MGSATNDSLKEKLAGSTDRAHEAMLAASRDGWGTTARYATLLIVGRGLPVVGAGLVAYVLHSLIP